jgi:putative transposase
MNGTPGRRVWYQFWDTHLTRQGSYMARLRYVNENPVHHGVVSNAANYRWCSAGWFARNASPAFFKAVAKMKTDRIKIIDDFR